MLFRIKRVIVDYAKFDFLAKKSTAFRIFLWHISISKENHLPVSPDFHNIQGFWFNARILCGKMVFFGLLLLSIVTKSWWTHDRATMNRRFQVIKPPVDEWTSNVFSSSLITGPNFLAILHHFWNTSLNLQLVPNFSSKWNLDQRQSFY